MSIDVVDTWPYTSSQCNIRIRPATWSSRALPAMHWPKVSVLSSLATISFQAASPTVLDGLSSFLDGLLRMPASNDTAQEKWQGILQGRGKCQQQKTRKCQCTESWGTYQSS